MFDEHIGFEHIVELTAIGPRVAGSAEEQAAADYLIHKLTSYGLTAETRGFPIRRWTERKVQIRAAGRPLACTGVSFTGAGAVHGKELEVAYVERATPFDLERAGELSGKALLVSRDVYVDYPDTALFERLRSYEPGAVIFTASPGHQGVPTVLYNFKDATRVPAPPCFVISHRDMTGIVTSRLPTLTITLDGEALDGHSQNVVGILEGVHRDEVVVVSAHHDTVPESSGATDNAGGCAAVLELARAFAAAGKPQRTIHFCSWGSHETGMHGSEAYISSLLAEGKNVVAMVNYDCIGMTIGDDQVDILGGPGWSALVEETIAGTAVEPLLRHGPGFTDFTNFGAAGIPSLSIQQSYLNFNHTPGDSLDKCSPQGLLKPLVLGVALLRAALAAPDFRAEFSPELQAHAKAFNGRWGWSQFG